MSQTLSLFSARAMLCAVLTRAIWENACGKLPSSRFAAGSYSSDNGGGLFVLAGGAVSTLLAGSRAPPRQPPRITDRLGNKHRAVDAAIVSGAQPQNKPALVEQRRLYRIAHPRALERGLHWRIFTSATGGTAVSCLRPPTTIVAAAPSRSTAEMINDSPDQDMRSSRLGRIFQNLHAVLTGHKG
jgi:hypothetical protein